MGLVEGESASLERDLDMEARAGQTSELTGGGRWGGFFQGDANRSAAAGLQSRGRWEEEEDAGSGEGERGAWASIICGAKRGKKRSLYY